MPKKPSNNSWWGSNDDNNDNDNNNHFPFDDHSHFRKSFEHFDEMFREFDKMFEDPMFNDPFFKSNFPKSLNSPDKDQQPSSNDLPNDDNQKQSEQKYYRNNFFRRFLKMNDIYDRPQLSDNVSKDPNVSNENDHHEDSMDFNNKNVSSRPRTFYQSESVAISRDSDGHIKKTTIRDQNGEVQSTTEEYDDHDMKYNDIFNQHFHPFSRMFTFSIPSLPYWYDQDWPSRDDIIANDEHRNHFFSLQTPKDMLKHIRPFFEKWNPNWNGEEDPMDFNNKNVSSHPKTFYRSESVVINRDSNGHVKKTTTIRDQNGEVQSTTEEYDDHDMKYNDIFNQHFHPFSRIFTFNIPSLPYWHGQQNLYRTRPSRNDIANDENDNHSFLLQIPKDPLKRIRPYFQKWNPFNWTKNDNNMIDNNNNRNNEGIHWSSDYTNYRKKPSDLRNDIVVQKPNNDDVGNNNN